MSNNQIDEILNDLPEESEALNEETQESKLRGTPESLEKPTVFLVNNHTVLFSPKETLRGTKWKYPFPVDIRTIDQYVSILGETKVFSLLQDAIDTRCQYAWRMCDQDVDKFLEYFLAEGRVSKMTASKMEKLAKSLLKELSKMDKKSPDYKAKFEEYKAANKKAIELMQEEQEAAEKALLQ